MLLKAAIQTVAAAMLAAFALAAGAQQAPMSYGPSVTLEAAKKMATATVAEARKGVFPIVVAITDPSGELVYLEKMDGTQIGSINVAIGKARSAARFKRPTKAFQDALAAGNVYLLGLEGANVVGGGLPIVIDGKIAGAIGISGYPSGVLDDTAAKAGLDALK